MVYKEVGGGCAEALVEVEKAEDSDEHLPAKEVASRDATFAGLVGDTAEHLPVKEVASSSAFVSSISSSNCDPVEVSESLLSAAAMSFL